MPKFLATIFCNKNVAKVSFCNISNCCKKRSEPYFFAGKLRTALGISRQSCNAETSTKTYLQQQDQFSISLSLRVSKENATLQIGCENQGYNAVLVGIIFFFLLKS